MSRPLSIADHSRMHSALVQAERLATYTLTAIRGRTAEEVGQEAAKRALDSLAAKRQPEGQARP